MLPSYDFVDYKRVLKYATNPTNNELAKTAAVAGVGLVLVGIIGYLIYIIISFVPF
jgi:protein transport protein SEC61 subunit gamma-like protein